MDNLAFVASVSLVVIASIVVAVGIYLLLLLHELRKTIQMLNTSLESASSNLVQFIASIQHVGSYALSFQSGLKTLETLVQWVKEKKSKDSDTTQKNSDK